MNMDPSQDLWSWVSCPYVPSHRVPKSRIQAHIIKCQKNHPPLEVCPYNATHRFTASEIKAHCQNCPDRPIQPIEIKPHTGGLITTPKPILQKEYLPETDPEYECWDD